MDEPVFSPDGKFMWSGSEWIPAPPTDGSDEKDITENLEQVQNLDLSDSVVTGDIDQNISVNQEKVVHGVNIEKVVLSQSLVDAFGMQGATGGITEYFGSETQIEVSDNLSPLKSAIVSKIDDMLDNPRSNLSEDHPHYEPFHAMSFRQQAQHPEGNKKSGFFGMAPGCYNSVMMVRHLEKLKEEVHFLSFGQSYMTPLIEMPTLAVTHNKVDHITLVGYNAAKNTAIVSWTYGDYKGKKKSLFKNPEFRIDWADDFVYCAITLDEFADFYVGTQHFQSTVIPWSRRRIMFQQ